MIGKAPGYSSKFDSEQQLTSAQKEFMGTFEGGTRIPNLKQDAENLMNVELLSRKIGDFA
jgi:hypothetical protein